MKLSVNHYFKPYPPASMLLHSLVRSAACLLALSPLVDGSRKPQEKVKVVEPKADEVPLSELIERSSPLRTHALYAPYVDQDLQNRWWDFGGDAIVNTNKHIRLTQDKKSQMGWLWSRLPIKSENFQIEVEFMVNGKGHNLYGDGFAVWLTTTRADPGPVFGSVDKFKGLGLFFDTYANARHSYSFPRVTAMMGDGQTEYDNAHDNAANEIAACSMDFRRRTIDTKMKLIYMKDKGLQLLLQVDKKDVWETCFQVETKLPSDEQLYFGFSALTGDVSDAHDIVSVTASNVYTNKRETALDGTQAPMDSKTRREQRRAEKNKKAEQLAKQARRKSGALGWFMFALKAIGVLAFLAFAASAYRTYNAQKQKSRRF